MARKAPKIALSQEEREYLQTLIARHTAEQREVLRAKIILSADKGKENQEIAQELGVTQDIVGKWRTRFFQQEKEGLEDRPRPGKPQKFDHSVRLKIIEVASHASWLNQIELWFSILSRKVLKRGIFNSKKGLVDSIMSFIERYNKEAKLFRWIYAGEPLRI